MFMMLELHNSGNIDGEAVSVKIIVSGDTQWIASIINCTK
jgi:hypothetical protein